MPTPSLDRIAAVVVVKTGTWRPDVAGRRFSGLPLLRVER
jgi:hypothetical protein